MPDYYRARLLFTNSDTPTDCGVRVVGACRPAPRPGEMSRSSLGSPRVTACDGRADKVVQTGGRAGGLDIYTASGDVGTGVEAVELGTE